MNDFKCHKCEKILKCDCEAACLANPVDEMVSTTQDRDTAEYRFCFYPQCTALGESVFTSDPVSTRELAKAELNLVATYTLHLHETSLMPDYSNFGFIEKIEKKEPGGKWEEVEELEEC